MRFILRQLSLLMCPSAPARRALLCLACVLLAAGAAAAPHDDASARIRLGSGGLHNTQQDIVRMRRAVAVLAGEECNGRGVGSEGEAYARAFLIEQCESLGLQPPDAASWTADFGPDGAGTDGAGLDGYLQPFTVADPTPARWEGDTALWAPGPGGWRAVELGKEAAPFKLSADGRARGEVVFAGYGIHAPALGWDDYAGLDLKGRIVLVLRGAPAPWRRAHGAAAREHMLFRQKVRAAARAGAAGLLLCNGAGEQDDDPNRALRAGGERVLPAFWLHRSVAEGLFGGVILGLVARQEALERLPVQREGGDREDGVPQGGETLRGPLGVSVELRVNLEDRPQTLDTANVVVWTAGSDPALAHEWVVLGAHYDHLGRRGFGSRSEDHASELHPGADDNASGVAVLIEVAARLAAAPCARPVAVVFFGAQEFVRSGSRHFAGSVPSGAEIVAMVNVDMVGRVESQGLRVEGLEYGDGLAPRVAALLEGVAVAPGIEVRAMGRAAGRSDHRSFLARGVPALNLTSGIHGQYRKPTDVDCLVEVEAMAGVVEIALALVRDLASGPTVPFHQAAGSGRK